MNLGHISESIYFGQDLIPFNVALSTVKMVVGDIKRKIEKQSKKKLGFRLEKHVSVLELCF